MSAFSDRLTRLMKKYDLTDDEMAKMFSVSRTTVLRWRNGERTPKLPKLVEIASYFNVNTSDFVESDVSNLKPVSSAGRVAIPKYGCVTAGPDGLALQEHLGYEYFDDLKNPEDYFSLDVEGDSMSGDGIYNGDVILIKMTPEIEFNGQIGVAVINGDEGTLKHIYIGENSITLQSSNPSYPPRVFIGEECNEVRIAGVLKEMKRKF